jgi:hypothetical protein
MYLIQMITVMFLYFKNLKVENMLEKNQSWNLFHTMVSFYMLNCIPIDLHFRARLHRFEHHSYPLWWFADAPSNWA